LDVVSSLIDTIAELDDRYAGREPDTDPAEWSRYQAERERLKALLEVALASRPKAP
jgi:hypothetical protein